MLLRRITASDPHGPTVRITAAVSVDIGRRTLVGTVYRYGETGGTSAGPLTVAPTMPLPPVGLPVTLEHDRDVIRGHIALVDNTDERLRIAVRVVDGELGDQALTEAATRERSAFSLDITDAQVVDGVIVSGRWEAVGQVAQPAFNSARIDQIAASLHPGERMNEQQRARLRELAAMNSRSTEQETEYAELTALAVAEATATEEQPATEPEAPAEPTAVAASHTVPTVPAGVPGPARAATTTRPRSALRQVVADITAGLQNGRLSDVTAALSDIIHTDHTGNIEPVAWSGELWSGLQYEPKFSDLLAQDTLTYWEGKGWRFTSKLAMQDYAGDKAAIPSGTVTTEPSTYEAARAAIGVDIDRKFYDFPNEGFVNSLLEQIRESWEILKDTKSRDYILANAAVGTRQVSVTKTSADATLTAPAGTFRPSDVGATITGTGIPASTTIASVTSDTEVEMSANATSNGTITATVGAQEGTVLKAAARARLIMSHARVGSPDWLILNDEDMFSLLDVNSDQVPAYLNLWNIDPADFRSSPDVPAGTVLAGVRPAAKFRQLPGSPIRVTAQNLANGGVDEAFFGYWAIETQHESGIVSVKFNPTA